MLSDQEVIAIIRRHLESKFPKDCLRCGRRYDSLVDYLLGTTHLGDPISGDDARRIPEPTKLIGTISYANCVCGSTLAMSSAGINPFIMWRLVRWAGTNMIRRGMSMGEVLSDLRSRIDEQVLREYFDKDSASVKSPRPRGSTKLD
jgi:hypothetical protein